MSHKLIFGPRPVQYYWTTSNLQFLKYTQSGSTKIRVELVDQEGMNPAIIFIFAHAFWFEKVNYFKSALTLILTEENNENLNLCNPNDLDPARKFSSKEYKYSWKDPCRWENLYVYHLFRSTAESRTLLATSPMWPGITMMPSKGSSILEPKFKPITLLILGKHIRPQPFSHTTKLPIFFGSTLNIVYQHV